MWGKTGAILPPTRLDLILNNSRCFPKEHNELLGRRLPAPRRHKSEVIGDLLVTFIGVYIRLHSPIVTNISQKNPPKTRLNSTTRVEDWRFLVYFW